MSTRSTLFLVFTALALTAYIWWSERLTTVQVISPSGAMASFSTIRPDDVQAIEISGARPLLRVERTNSLWHLTYPVRQLAQAASVDQFLDSLAELKPEGYLSAAEIGNDSELQKSFGLEEPDTLRISIQGRGGNQIFKIGNRAPLGTRFFFQRIGESGVFSANQQFLDVIPKSFNEWRDSSLIHLTETSYDRMELHQRGNLAFEAVRPPDKGWQLKRPLSARADTARLQALIHYLQTARVQEFLESPESVVDKDTYGLNPPVASWILRRGTNVLAHLQVGATSPDDPTARYVYRPDTDVLVLASAEILSLLNLPLNSYRDRRLIASIQEVDQFGLAQPDGFLVARQDTNWNFLSPISTAASPPLVQVQLDIFAGIEIAEFVNDVITDLSRYGFDQPQREYTLYRQTNILSQIQFGSFVPPENVLVYARRLDEPAVYAVPRSILTQLAASHLQILETAFTPEQVARIEIKQRGQRRELVQTGNVWNVPDDPDDLPLDEAIEETLLRWGQLVAERFLVDNPERLREVYKIDEIGHSITLIFRSGANLRRWHLELGGRVGSRLVAFSYFDEDPQPVQLFLPENVVGLLLTQLNAPPPRLMVPEVSPPE